MKNLLIKIFTLGVILISGKFTLGQVSVYDTKEEDYVQLKKSTLYFVCPDFLMEDENELQNLLTETWTYSDIKVISYKKLDDYIDKENSAFLTLNYGFIYAFNSIQKIYYELWMNGKPNQMRKNFKKVVFANAYLDFKCEFDSIVTCNHNYNLIIPHLYKKADIQNLKPGIICNNLKTIQMELKTQKSFYPNFETYKNSEELKKLSEDTLYITDNIKFEHSSKVTLKKYQCCVSELKIKDIMSKYPYPYKIVSFDELNDKLINGDKFIYLIYINLSVYFNNISICDNTGKCIYSASQVEGYNPKKSIGKIAKLITK